MAIDLLDGERLGVSTSHGNDPRSDDVRSDDPRKMISENMFEDTPSSDTMVGAILAATCPLGGLETILLVEDEAFVRKVTAEVLESVGYRLVIASSAAEALEACRGCLPPLDLLFADVVMPGMSGRELAVEFAGFYPRAGVLLMSGYAEQLTGGELSHYGQQYLAKPFSISKLLSRVREVLDKPVDSAGWTRPRSFCGSA